MEIPVGGGEIEFQSNYRLLALGEQTLASPMAALGFPSLSAVQNARNNMDVHLKKLEGYSKFGLAGCGLGTESVLLLLCGFQQMLR